jgi:serine/threonine protein kinase
MSKIKHKNLIHMYDAMQDSVTYYLVMDYCPGGDLLDHQLKQPTRKFTEKTAVFYLSCLRDAFLCLKLNDIMHRDIKLENLFLDSNGNLKVGDFGFAKHGDESFTKLGSHNTMAPEIFFHINNHSKKYDEKCDLWSIGVVFHIMLFGKKPYFCDVHKDDKIDFNKMKRSLHQFNAQHTALKDISIESADLIRRLLTKNPKHRISKPMFLVN